MFEILNRPGFVVFTTRDFAAAGELSVAAASHRLARLAKSGSLTRVVRGVWANTAHPHFHPLACVPYLLENEQGYVSFLTALHLHGVIAQIPATIQVATTGHTRRLESPVGTYEFLKVKPELMKEGVDWSDTRQPYLIATAEKALLDVFYVSTRKNRRFSRLPELDTTESGFRRRELERLLRVLPYSTPIRSSISARWESTA
jgi:predicted transcriptional regulator of viral defense system